MHLPAELLKKSHMPDEKFAGGEEGGGGGTTWIKVNDACKTSRGGREILYANVNPLALTSETKSTKLL